MIAAGPGLGHVSTHTYTHEPGLHILTCIVILLILFYYNTCDDSYVFIDGRFQHLPHMFAVARRTENLFLSTFIFLHISYVLVQ
jgi:hypothetical protein